MVLLLVRDIEIVGQTAAQVAELPRNEFVDIPWGKIVAMRKRLVHAYFSINLYRALKMQQTW